MLDLQTGLNERQREAVLCTEGPLLVIAGAGAGKTKMLTTRISYLIEGCRVPPYQILAMTFTNKAAGEMKERVEKILVHSQSSALGSPEIGTFHSFCVRLLRRELLNTPFTKPFVIYDDSDQLSLIKSVLRKLNIDDKAFNPKAMQGRINRAKCDALEPQELEALPHDLFAKHLKRVYEEYQKDLTANNALDFGEIICMTYRLLRDRLDIRERYQQRFRYIHVDEYQDTNRAQYLLLSLLAAPRNGGHQNICVVGDEDQSIYKWRGADINNILDFETEYPGAKVVKLEQNYRSTKTILEVAGKVIRNNKSRKEKTLWTENEQGQSVIRAQLADERAEAEMVVSEVKRIAGNDGRSYNEFSIFYRTNAQSRPFEDVLRREKIPYQIIGGLRFYDRKEIKDVLSYFKAIMNPSDSVSLKRIINVPGRGIGKTSLDRLEQFHMDENISGTVSYWEILQKVAQDPLLTSSTVAKRVGLFVKLMQRFIDEQPKLLLSELYHLILDETAYVVDLRKEGTDEATARIENMEEFNSLLQEFEEDFLEKIPEIEREAKKTELLPLFIEQSALASDIDKLSGDTSTVKLMTLHSSKGLEFPVVFLVGMEEGLFPSIKPWEETPEEDIEEERRLCYVGMTRARETLYLMNATIRRIWGNISYQEPSRFFIEIPEDSIEFRDFSYGSRASEFRTGSSRQFGFNANSNSVYKDSGSQVEYDGGGRPMGQVVGRIGPAGISPFGSGLTKDEWIGKQISHPEYGKGTVVASEGSGQDQKVTIQFLSRQQKKFLLRYVASYFG
jgi:DNA helicase-2/ATP-dependent DNA helicase PcrA